MIAPLMRPACVLCGRQHPLGPDGTCWRCRAEADPTPFAVALDCAGWTHREFSELTGIPMRTVRRAVRGQRVSARVAARLAKVTGLPPATFRPPKPSPAKESTR